MTDETNLDEALKADEDVAVDESPASEQPVVETPGLEVTEGPIDETLLESEGEKTESTEEVEAAPKEEGRKTAQSRIRDLVAEKKAAEAKADSLADQVKKLTQNNIGEPYIPPANDDASEMTVEEVLRRADALAQIRVAQANNVNRVQQEALEAINAYPELNPDSDSFDPDLSESISKATLAQIQANPTAPVRGFVDSMMKPYKNAVEKQASSQQATISKQVAEQAMRPTQVQEQEKPDSELSIQELERKYGVVYR